MHLQLVHRLLQCVLVGEVLCTVLGWRSIECPIDSQDTRENYLCIRPCDYETLSNDLAPSRSQHSKENQPKAPNKDNFLIVFFPPKNTANYESSRVKCPTGFKQVTEGHQCFCERPYTPYELEMQRREQCDQAFERCRMYGAKAYDCNHIVDACPPVMVRDYCLAGKVYKMRFATVVYNFCHAFLRLPNDGRRHFLEPDIDRLALAKL